jgi:hypothetical protein
MDNSWRSIIPYKEMPSLSMWCTNRMLLNCKCYNRGYNFYTMLHNYRRWVDISPHTRIYHMRGVLGWKLRYHYNYPYRNQPSHSSWNPDHTTLESLIPSNSNSTLRFPHISRTYTILIHTLNTLCSSNPCTTHITLFNSSPTTSPSSMFPPQHISHRMSSILIYCRHHICEEN